MRRKPHGITRAFLCVIRYTMILPKILKNFAELLRAVTHHHHHHRTWTWRLSACTRLRGPREAALLARRRAQPARRRREVVAQLRRRSRVGFAPCDPVPALRSSVVEAAAPKSSWSAGSSADLVTRSKRAVSRRAEPLQRARWPASTRQQCLLADPLARHSTECAAATRRASHPVLAAPPSPTRSSPPRSRAAAVWLVWRVSVSLTE